MRILVTVDPEIPVPPLFYGGVERLVEGVLKYYVGEGHQVALVANRESSSSWPETIFKWPASSSRGFSNTWKNAWFLRKCISSFHPDVVHSFSRLLYMYPTFFTKSTPFLQTYGRFISQKSTLLASLVAGKKIRFTCCGKHMIRKDLFFKSKFKCVYNFTEPELYPLRTEEKHLLYLGRIQDLKGTSEAIQTALQTGNQLIIAGNIQPGEESYFKEKVEPFIDHKQIRYVGPVNDQQKSELFRTAKAFLFPIKWEEPFGMVMVEAMAAGIPVIAFKRGAVPEIVLDQINGLVVENLDEMLLAVKNLENYKFDSEAIRQRVEECFSLETIGQQYLNELSLW